MRTLLGVTLLILGASLPSVAAPRPLPGDSFLPAVWGDDQVIALGADDDHAVVGTPDRAFLWVLSRTPRMDPALYHRLLDEAKGQAFDVSKVVATPQQPGT
jgi:lipocalin